ncbi:MAG: DinB family protein [Chloroflexi bacterium]|nr:DinB family protein [Chloroflexota bacterium]
MEAQEYIQHQWAAVRRTADAVLTDIDDAQLNYQPPGTASSAGVALVHLLTGEDYFVNVLMRGQTRLWESEGWATRTGITLPASGGSWEEFKRCHFALDAVRLYAEAVRSSIDSYLATLTDDDLRRLVVFRDAPISIAALIGRMFIHTASHSGEIAAVRGFQGARGLPF